MSPVQSQQGFTLLEVLVAFLLAALLLSVILSGFANGMSSWSRVDKMSQAAMIAQSRLAELSVQPVLVEGEYTGTTEDDVVEFSWQVRVRPLDWGYGDALLEQGQQLYKIEVDVDWPASLGAQSYRLETLRLSGVGE